MAARKHTLKQLKNEIELCTMAQMEELQDFISNLLEDKRQRDLQERKLK